MEQASIEHTRFRAQLPAPESHITPALLYRSEHTEHHGLSNTLVIRVLRTGPLEHRVTRDHQTGILAQIDRCNYTALRPNAITAWAHAPPGPSTPPESLMSGFFSAGTHRASPPHPPSSLIIIDNLDIRSSPQTWQARRLSAVRSGRHGNPSVESRLCPYHPAHHR